MDQDLQATLQELLRVDGGSNAALGALIDDYSRYHAVLAGLGSGFTIALIGIAAWRRRRLEALRPDGPSTFARRTYLACTSIALLIAAFLGLVSVANVSNVAQPRDGLKGSVALLQSAPKDQTLVAFHAATAAWLRSGGAAVPATVQARVDERLSWQRPKAVVCVVLLALFVLLAHRVWRRLIASSRVAGARWNARRLGLLTVGLFTGGMSVLLMLMVMGNVQASIAPLAATVFLG